MDYEKKYKEAMERARQFFEKPYLEDCAGIIGYIFPELSESEDERIRKELIEFVKSRGGFKQEYITWLEKQGKFSDQIHYWTEKEIEPIISDYLRGAEHYGGMIARLRCLKPKSLEKQEQKPNYCHYEVDLTDCSEEYRKAYYDGWNNCNQQHSQCRSELDDVVKCLINGMKFYYEDNEEATWGTDKWSMPVKHIIEVLERQGEQKPIKEHNVCDFCEGRYGCVNPCPMKLIEEQKPAWSEEDKRIIDNLISQLGNLYARKLIKEETKDKYVNWLKLLKDRVLPKPAKWSEEDWNYIADLISYFDGSSLQHDTPDVISWLKSLRPQNKWKPSDKQMEAVRIAAEIGTANNSWAMGILKDMYQDLKKLKG